MPEVYGPVDNLAPPNLGRAAAKRSIPTFFSGGAHGSIRETLINHWEKKDDEIRIHDTSQKVKITRN
ncbi:hypothetical protein LguiB_027809 [Lonicera macranthoides]